MPRALDAIVSVQDGWSDLSALAQRATASAEARRAKAEAIAINCEFAKVMSFAKRAQPLRLICPSGCFAAHASSPSRATREPRRAIAHRESILPTVVMGFRAQPFGLPRNEGAAVAKPQVYWLSLGSRNVVAISGPIVSIVSPCFGQTRMKSGRRQPLRKSAGRSCAGDIGLSTERQCIPR
jgi:hypothetical protein